MRVLIDRVTGSAPGPLGETQLRQLYGLPTTPWLRVNMVSTADGAATGPNGRTGSINNEVDRHVFHLLRAMADVVVVGSGTARAERYRPGGVPLVLVSRRGELPALLRQGAPGQVLLATCARALGLEESREVLGAENVLVLGEHHVDLAVLRQALVDRGLRRLLSEGGPHLLAALLRGGVVDELCMTLVPRLLSGAHLRITAGEGVDVPLDLRLLLEEEGTLLSRWFVPR